MMRLSFRALEWRRTLDCTPIEAGDATPHREQCCQVNRGGPQLSQPAEISGGGRHPRCLSPGAEATKGRAGDQMSLGIEGVVDRGVGGEKALS